MERRSFLRYIEQLGAGALCAGLASVPLGCTSLRYVPAVRESNRLAVRRTDVEQHPFVFLVNPQGALPIYLHRSGDGRYTALLTRCTHRGCQVERAGDRLACPCHGSEYAFTGDVLQGPAERALYRYDVSTDADHIYVHLPDSPQP